MKRRNRTGKFWTTLTVFNLIAIVFPYTSLIQADSNNSRSSAAFVYFGTLLLLAIIDVVAVTSTRVHRGELLDIRS
jgi:hypothetical protein